MKGSVQILFWRRDWSSGKNLGLVVETFIPHLALSGTSCVIQGKYQNHHLCNKGVVLGWSEWPHLALKAHNADDVPLNH